MQRRKFYRINQRRTQESSHNLISKICKVMRGIETIWKRTNFHPDLRCLFLKNIE